MRKIGKVGRANIKARQIIAEISEDLGLNFCEIRFDECLGGSFLAPAHKEKRGFYQGDVERLSDYKEWVAACVNCHNEIEHNRELTLETFKRLRP